MAVRLEETATTGNVDIQRDRVLVQRFQAGDADAFDELYRRYLPRLVRFCDKRLGDRHEAEEVAQEAFTRALRAMPGFAGERRFYPWVTVIASRLCIDTHRRRARTSPESEIDLGPVEGGQDEIVDAVDADLLHRALERLGPRHREVLHLRETEGWSYQRIAEHYDVSMSTVEALLFRARKALRREFLAIAPRDGGLLAGVPLLGYLLRKAGSARTRLGSWNAGNVLPFAANVSAAIAIGSVAVLVPGHAGSGSNHGSHVVVSGPAAVAPPAPAMVAAPVPVAAPAAALASAPPAASASITPPVAAPSASRPAVPTRQHAVPASVGRASDSGSFAASAPVSADDGHLVLGADPTQLVRSTASNTAGWMQQLAGGDK